MRSPIFAIALLAASAVASPIQKIRDLTGRDVVYVTRTYYIAAGDGHRFGRHRPTVIQTQTAPDVVVTQTPEQPPAPQPPTPQSPAPEPEAASVPAGNDYISSAVNSHNVHRANHSVNAVSWDAQLASIAAQIAASCRFEHDTATGGGGYGQNLAAGYTAGDIAKVISDGWYNSEVRFFTQYGVASPDMGNFHAWGHFTQVVWKDTDRIGCATQYCAGGLAGVGKDVPPHFTVCNYRNTGNVMTLFDKNVFKPLNQPTVLG